MALFFYKEKNKDIRAAAYLRLSIEDGDKAESNSIGNQRELIRDFAAERPGLHLVEEYADDGYTGTNFERPGFKRMMEDIKSGKINCIIVKDLSRLGRNYIEMGKYLEQIFPMMRIRFIAINDNYDNANTESSDSDSIVVPFKNLLNDSYCRDISIKVRSQLDMKRRKERNDWKLDLCVGDGADAIELEIFAEPNPPKRVNRPEACGLRHLAFRVENVEATVEELAQMGIECEPIRLDSYTKKKMTFFFDPDGLPLELHE